MRTEEAGLRHVRAGLRLERRARRHRMIGGSIRGLKRAFMRLGIANSRPGDSIQGMGGLI